MCYGVSAAFHGMRLSGDALYRLQRLDHVGIYLLIAGTYTPVAWALMRRSWSRGTLTTVWTVALLCAFRVWRGGVMPNWLSTPVYLAMGWGALFCYFELAKTYSHSTLLPLPLGGVFYSVGAVFNLMRWPVILPGVFGAHELLHFLVIAGSSCHIFFMVKVVVPSPASAQSPAWVNSSRRVLVTRHNGALALGSRWLAHFPSHRRHVRGALPLRSAK
jgi:hemolysin III